MLINCNLNYVFVGKAYLKNEFFQYCQNKNTGLQMTVVLCFTQKVGFDNAFQKAARCLLLFIVFESHCRKISLQIKNNSNYTGTSVVLF